MRSPINYNNNTQTLSITLENQMISINARLDNLESRILEILGEIGALPNINQDNYYNKVIIDNKLENIKNDINDRFNAMYNNIETRFLNIQRVFEETLTNMQKTFQDAINTVHDEIDGKIDDINERLQELNNRIDELNNQPVDPVDPEPPVDPPNNDNDDIWKMWLVYMAKQTIRQKYSALLECNGLDKNYQVLHMLNTKQVLVQLIEEENWHTFTEDKYICVRDTDNTLTIRFNAPPIARKKFYVMCLRME